MATEWLLNNPEPETPLQEESEDGVDVSVQSVDSNFQG